LQAAVSALQNQPVVNAVIDGDDIIYRDYIDISVAVGTSKVWTPFSLCLNALAIFCSIIG
jgi:pyruvate/2-oxoglutarate dehydrogenase complex dihydrolipoamide acyltransferase (E2) component